MHESADAEPRARLAASWVSNATAWTEVVQAGAIPSRRAGTDAAILRAAARLRAGRLLDVGCGEGWLARALAAAGHAVTGIDASAPLIDAARRASDAADPDRRPRFAALPYAALPAHLDTLGGPFAAAVCNFALLDDDLAGALAAVHTALVPGGTLLIQTVHPFTALADGSYADGWREERFDAFGAAFPATMPWFYRTVGSWCAGVTAAGFALDGLEEPRADGHPLPLSLLITATRT